MDVSKKSDFGIQDFIKNPLRLFESEERMASVGYKLMYCELKRSYPLAMVELCEAIINSCGELIDDLSILRRMICWAQDVNLDCEPPYRMLLRQWALKDPDNFQRYLKALVKCVAVLGEQTCYVNATEYVCTLRVAKEFVNLHFFNFDNDRKTVVPHPFLIKLYEKAATSPYFAYLLSDIHFIAGKVGYKFKPTAKCPHKVGGRCYFRLTSKVALEGVNRIYDGTDKFVEHDEFSYLEKLTKNHGRKLIAIFERFWEDITDLAEVRPRTYGSEHLIHVEGLLGEVHGSSRYFLLEEGDTPKFRVLRMQNCKTVEGTVLHKPTFLQGPGRMRNLLVNELSRNKKGEALRFHFINNGLMIIALHALITLPKDEYTFGIPLTFNIENLKALL